MNRAFLLLGANIGDALQTLKLAYAKIEQHIGSVNASSKIYSSQAWGVESQPDFLNQVLSISTKYNANALLQQTQEIEKELGRIRHEKWGPRTIDIDILYYNTAVIDRPQLKIPHPHLQERRFTLVPLVEIAPQYLHPVFKKTNTQLLNDCSDSLNVHELSEQ